MMLRMVAAETPSLTRAGERARADRLAGLEIGLDQPAEDLAAALVHLAQRRAGAVKAAVRSRRPRRSGRGRAAVNSGAALERAALDGGGGAG